MEGVGVGYMDASGGSGYGPGMVMPGVPAGPGPQTHYFDPYASNFVPAAQAGAVGVDAMSMMPPAAADPSPSRQRYYASSAVPVGMPGQPMMMMGGQSYGYMGQVRDIRGGWRAASRPRPRAPASSKPPHLLRSPLLFFPLFVSRRCLRLRAAWACTEARPPLATAAAARGGGGDTTAAVGVATAAAAIEQGLTPATAPAMVVTAAATVPLEAPRPPVHRKTFLLSFSTLPVGVAAGRPWEGASHTFVQMTLRHGRGAAAWVLVATWWV